MAPAREGWELLEAGRAVGQQELARLCGLRSADIDELVEYGTLRPVGHGVEQELVFPGDCVSALRRAAQLKLRYDLDLFSMALLVEQLQRIEQLEARVRWLQAHLPHGARTPREGPGDSHEPHP